VTLSILQRIAAGDPHAVDECLDQYRGLIWSLARRLSPVYADAEDAVQEIYLEIWRCASRFDPQVASETAFIATIAKRRLIDRHRRRSRDIDAAPIEDESAIASSAVTDTIELQEEAERVRVVMGRLRHDERRVLEMSLVNGLTHSEISEATSLRLGTVKTHARRGLNRLREMLGVDHSSSTPEP
jgi:RNA polymerase sigma-70 factor (ECF subfamily)